MFDIRFQLFRNVKTAQYAKLKKIYILEVKKKKYAGCLKNCILNFGSSTNDNTRLAITLFSILSKLNILTVWGTNSLGLLLHYKEYISFRKF